MKEEWQDIFQFYVEDRNRRYLYTNLSDHICSLTVSLSEKERLLWERVEQELKERRAQLVDAKSSVRVSHVIEDSPLVKVYYRVEVYWGMEHYNKEYTQAWVENRLCILKNDRGWWVLSDDIVEEEGVSHTHYPLSTDEQYMIQNPNERRASYDRTKAVAYAQQWWNDYNPKFKKFDVDCTNYVSQCMWAGHAPMKYSSDRAKGWWYRFDPVNWSFSWAVAHSLRWYLPNSQSGLRATEVFSADQLQPGDVICYDFDGDGRWEHNTIVVGKDGAGMPLVNAHTTNSQNRYWSYTDSHAYTDKTSYKFLRIADQF